MSKDLVDVTELVRSKYLKLSDLAGQPVNVKFYDWDHREMKSFAGGMEKKLCLVLKNGIEWTPNQSALKVLIKLFGPNPEAWMGQRVTLFPTRAGNFDCIGVRAYTPPQPQPQPAMADGDAEE